MTKTATTTTGWLALSVMVMLTAALPPTGTLPPVAENSLQRHLVKRDDPASRIRPIASKPLEVRDEDPDSDTALAANYLIQFGYHRSGKPLDFLAPPPGGSAAGQQEDEQTKAIRRFQSFFGLSQTGTLDEDTLKLMKRDRRCGVADLPPDENEDSSHVTHAGSQSPSSYALMGTKWDKNRLNWKLDTSSTRQLTSSVQRRVLQKAFSAWRRVTPLEFDERAGGQVDIDIKFGARHHGDDYPFDGKGKVLAHAFGPGPGDIDGDMHIDNEEDWSSAKTKEVSDLYLVATHELGHSLGLSHSRDPDALMYPYYGLTDRLGRDDIKAIQSLYGIRIDQPTTRRPVTRAPRPTTTTRRPITRRPYTRRPTRTDRPRPQTTTSAPVADCGARFDVVIQDPRNKAVYTGIQGDTVYRFNSDGVMPGFPTRLNYVFPGAPAHAETVFTVPEKSATYFVKDNKVWRYDGTQPAPDYPKTLDPTHFPEVIRFVLPIVDSTGYRRIFVFGRTLWWEYNFDDVRVGTHYRPRPSFIPQYWPAITTDVSYAVMGTDNYIYLITRRGHIVLDSFRRALPGGRREGYPPWMRPACYSRMYSNSGTTNVQNFHLTWCVAALNLLLLVLTKY
ncbi:collagenase 3-like [Babylonia areolata]|uniref:collagenase 3-like n=1 Tax=Babylonia areolata TaxID=304850 RepID=UPI003FD3D0D9